MKKLMALGIGLLMCMGAAPSRTYTYTAGQIISPTEVSTNEDSIFTYLQAGVDTYSSGSVNSAAIADGSIANIDISSSAAIVYSKLSLASSIVTGDVVDNTLTTSDLAATLTFSDGDLLDLSSINDSSATEGLKLPQNTACTSGTDEGQICWDTNDDLLYVGDGAAAKLVGAFAVPALTLSTSNSAGVANTGIRSDATILVFDATAPSELGTASAGVASTAARRDHVHALAGVQLSWFFSGGISLALPTSPTWTTFAITGGTTDSITFYKHANEDTLVFLAMASGGDGNSRIRILIDGATAGTSTTVNGAVPTFFTIESGLDISALSTGWHEIQIQGTKVAGGAVTVTLWASNILLS